MNLLKSLTISLAAVFFMPTVLAESPFAKQFDVDEVIEGEIQNDPRMVGAFVEASFLDGFVNLEGHVDNLWQKKRLIEIGHNIHGSKGVLDKLDIALACVESEDLAKSAALEIYRDETADLRQLKIVADNYGRIEVSGEADSKQEKKAALSAAMRVKGVNSAGSEIKIKAKEQRSDSEIEKDLEFALYDNVLIDERLIEAQVIGNTAKLEGNTGSQTETLAVQEIAEGIPGVKDVKVVELTVVPRFDRTLVFKVTPLSEVYTDEALAKAVDTANYYDTRVFSYNIDVDARDGVVKLSGTAKNEAAKRAALENAGNTIGVKGVVDDIAIEGEQATQELFAE